MAEETKETTGCVDGDCKNGTGTYIYYSGKYVGEFKDGKKHGQGTYNFRGGNQYVGEFKDDKRHGQGTYTYAAVGEQYVGEFKDDKQHGQGTNTYASGAKYVGDWKDGKKHGKFISWWDNGQKKGRETYKDGELISEEWY